MHFAPSRFIFAHGCMIKLYVCCDTWRPMTEPNETPNGSIENPELTKRQEEILSLVVHAYTHSPEPISSKHVLDKSDLSISSATIRMEMARLEEMGYLTSPHTSAGRVPTAMGYRYVVRDFIKRSDGLTTLEREHISTRINDLPNMIEQWMRQAATILARTVQIASLVTPPTTETAYFKHLELIAIQGRLALMVLVLEGGIVQQRMLSLAEVVTQHSLSDIAERINELCGGLNANQMRVKTRHLDSFLEREIVDIAAELVEQSLRQHVPVIYRDGLSEIINTFPDAAGAQQAVRVYEERPFLEWILNEVLRPLLNENEDVQVIIAGDDRWEELSRLSMVLSRYGIPGRMAGTLGVLGPPHMDYGRAISTVRHVSGLMTERLHDLYNSDNPAAAGGTPPHTAQDAASQADDPTGDITPNDTR